MKPWQKLLAGALGLGTLITIGWAVSRRQPKPPPPGGQPPMDVTEDEFLASLPASARPYGPTVWHVAQTYALDPWLLAAVIQHESYWGRYLTADGRGADGHGYGLMQIDDRYWGPWLAANDWRDPAVNIAKGAEILKAALETFPGDERAGIARYNASEQRIRAALARGDDPASVTTHHNGLSYVDHVLRQKAALQASVAVA